jgi:hypothetical protein
MSMARVRGKLGNGAIIMGPDFTATRDAQGKWTANGEFRVLRGDFERNDVQAKFAPGNPITAIAGNALSSQWSFLLIDSVDSTDEPGGITVVRVSFTGFTENQWDFDKDRNKTYTRTGSLVEKSILDNPYFVEEVVSKNEVMLIKAAMDGTIVARDHLAAELELTPTNGSDRIVGKITSAEGVLWYDTIVVRGNHTYMEPAMEWTESATGLGKLTSTELGKLGKIDTSVPGSPTAPDGHKWMMTSATEEMQQIGEGANSYSRTWTSGNWASFIYEDR